MKANEAKSKFVYPDKLYARCKDNKTLDMSYAPQNMEAVEYIRTDAFIEKACKWIEDNINEYTCGEDIQFTRENTYNIDIFNQTKFVKDFGKYMEE